MFPFLATHKPAPSPSSLLAEQMSHAFCSCLESLPVISSCFESEHSSSRTRHRNGSDNLFYASGRAVCSLVGGTLYLGFATTRAVISLGLGVGYGTSKLCQKTAAVGGSILTLMMAYDSFIYLTGREFPLHTINPCSSKEMFPTIMNVWLNLFSTNCEHSDLEWYRSNVLGAQVLFIPVAIGATILASYTFKLLAEGFRSCNKRLYSSL